MGRIKSYGGCRHGTLSMQKKVRLVFGQQPTTTTIISSSGGSEEEVTKAISATDSSHATLARAALPGGTTCLKSSAGAEYNEKWLEKNLQQRIWPLAHSALYYTTDCISDH